MPTPRASADAGLLHVLSPEQVEADAPRRRLPSWLKRPIPASRGTYFTRDLIGELGLETICESGKCPNRSECWTRRTATFMILGETCTRPCGFCAVKRGKPEEVAADEPERLAEACARLGLRHVVITSVTRDDLADDRGPDPRLRRRRDGDRDRALCPARGLQSQHGNGGPTPAAREAQEPV